MHVVDGVPKKQIAERLGLDIKTVRRAVAQAASAGAPSGVATPSSARWRCADRAVAASGSSTARPRASAGCSSRLAGPAAERTVRWRYVARLEAAAAPKDVLRGTAARGLG